MFSDNLDIHKPTFKHKIVLEETYSKMMYEDSALYSRFDKPKLDHAESVLKTFHIELPDKATVLDAGCGTGEVTRFLLQNFPTIEHLIALDISEIFIQYAKNNNSEARIEYSVANLQDLNSIKDNWVEKFDFIFSSMVFHWLPNQDLGLEFLARCLKPGRSFLLSFLSKPCPGIVHTNAIFLKHPKWRQYFQQVNNSVLIKGDDDTWHSGGDLVEDYIKIVTKNEKLHVIKAAIHPLHLKFASDEDYKGFVQSISSLLKLIPEHLREEFMQNYMYELQKVSEQDVDGSWIWHVETLVIIASRVA